MLKINFKELERVIFSGQNLKTVMSIAEPALEKAVEKSQKEMVQDFNSHPVTKEIESGPEASNISGTLNYGNLFSFIGFSKGSNPINGIRNILSAKFPVKLIHKNNNKFQLQIGLDEEKIYKENPYPWASGDSWVRGIERGISGLSHFLQKSSNSRSGGGIQVKRVVQQRFYKPILFLSQLIRNFTKRI